MKKHLFFLFAALTLMMAPGAMKAQNIVTIGDGTGTTTQTPYYSLYNYSFVEQIYTAAEIDKPTGGLISSISFYMTDSNDQSITMTVFMKNVSRSTFSSSTDYESVDDAVVVYEGGYTFTQGWNTIELSTPFHYNGTDNLMIAIDEHHSWQSRHFYSTSTADAVLSYYSDNLDPDPSDLDAYSGGKMLTVNRANIQITFAPEPVSPVVEIGSGNATNVNLPTNVNFNYSLTEQIYTEEEIGQAGDIYTIAFYNTSDATTRNLDIYMRPTNQSTFNSGNSWSAVPASSQVYSGNVTFLSDTWTTIVLNTPFHYSGSGNIMVVVDDNTGQSDLSLYFKAFDATAPRAWYIFNDNTNYNPTSSGSGWCTAINMKNQIRFGFAPVTCSAPTNFTVSNIGSNGAGVSWDQPGGGDHWIVQYSTNPDFTNSSEDPVGSSSWYIYGLTPSTTYYVRVANDCGSDGMSSWSNTETFTTAESPCLAPTDLTVSSISYNGAELSWNQPGDGYEWMVEYSTTPDFSSSTTEISYDIYWSLTELYPITTYYVRVSNFCGTLGNSDWVTTSFTTTGGVIVIPDNIDFETGDIASYGFVNDANYPWIVVSAPTDCGNCDSYCMMSGNAGVPSSTSSIEITHDFPGPGSISFDAKCMGEGEDWDVCVFLIDGTPQFSYGEYVTGWNHYEYLVTAGTHTFTWLYTKDSTVDPEGDGFFVDNIEFNSIEVFSSANWYAYASVNDNSPEWLHEFVSFSMENPMTVAEASNTIDDRVMGATSVNGFVWYTTYQNNTILYRAPLDDVNKTIGTAEIMNPSFLPDNDYVIQMAYNPNDGQVYYVEFVNYSGDNLLKKFDPQNPVGTDIGTLSISIKSLAINIFGEAYCVDNDGYFYQVDLSDASVSLIGSISGNLEGYYQAMAFDPWTGELFWSKRTSSGNELYLVDPATLAITYLGYIGDDAAKFTGMFKGTTQCLPPSDLVATPDPNYPTTVNLSWTENGAARNWVVEVSTTADFSDISLTIWVPDDPETSIYGDELVPGTQYYARVYAECDPSTISDWSNVLAFTTPSGATDLIVEIGSCTSVSSYLPSASHYNYSLTQQIYTAAEVGQAGDISSVSFYNAGDTKTRTYDVYLVHTDKTSFSNASDWVPVTAADRVFSGTVEMTAGEWTTLEFDNTFQYNGTQNLLLVVDDNTGSWSLGMNCYVFDATDQALRIYSNYLNVDPYNLSSNSGLVMTSKNCVKFTFETNPCPAPTNFTVSNIGSNGAGVSWDQPGGGDQWIVQYSTNPDFSNSSEDPVGSTSWYIYGLTPNTTYYVRVANNCGSDGISAWSNAETFTTTESPCIAPTDLTVSSISYNGADLSWEQPGGGFDWLIEYSTNSDFSSSTFVNSFDPFWSLTDLYPITTYYVRVSNDCGTLGNSEWVTTSFTTTGGVIVIPDIIDFELGDFSQYPFDNSSSYPWIIADASNGCDNGTTYCMRSGNAGIANSSSVIEATYNYSAPGYIVFDAKCMGEGTNTLWDYCDFLIDGVLQFKHGADIANSGWLSYHFEVTAGSHTFTWSYTKDGSEDPIGDGFFVDNIQFGVGEPCVFPSNLAVNATHDGSAAVSWNGYSSSFVLRYRPDGGAWTTVTGITDATYTITGLSFGNYEVEVSASCDPTDWTGTTFAIMEVLSTANWYGYGASTDDSWYGHYITFSMQDPATVTETDPSVFPENFAAAYANGYVWFIGTDLGLYRASLDNTNKTIGAYEKVETGFNTSGTNAVSMAYNPIDGWFYYVSGSPRKLWKFNPALAAPVSEEVGELDFNALTFAINSSGEAYGVEYLSGDFYQINLADASSTFVGNTGKGVNYVQSMAFDLVTGELFWAQFFDYSDNALYKVDPATANCCFLGHIGNGSYVELTGLFMGDDNQATCSVPSELTVSENGKYSATISWTENDTATEWQVCLNGDESNAITVTTNSCTLTGLTPNTSYTVQVRANCGGSDGVSLWSTGMNFITFSEIPILSTATWYGYARNSTAMYDYANQFVSFSMQDPAMVTTATGTFSNNYIYSSAYVDGYVWCININGDLVKASVNNQSRTISDFETVVSGLESSFVNCMSYNPVNDRIYYIYNNNLKSFDPMDPTNVALEGTFGFSFTPIVFAINSAGEAYCISLNTSNAELYSLNLDAVDYDYVGPMAPGTNYAQSMAFDLQTGELFWAQRNNNRMGLYLVDPATAECYLIGEIGGGEGTNVTALFMVESSNPLVEIGTGTGTSCLLPTYTLYNNTLSQQIYTAAEIGQSGDIYNVAFYNTSSAVTRNIDVYMVHTDKTAFSDGTDWTAVTSADLVFSGNVQFSYDDWTVLDFSTPFHYNGTDNLLLVVDDNTGSWTGSRYFKTFEATGQALQIYSDETNYNPSNPSIYDGTVKNVKNQIQLGFAPILCHRPTDLTVSDVTLSSATLSWTENGTVTEWQVCVNGDEANAITVPTNHYTLTGLTLGTDYTVKVRANCGGSDGVSAWSAEREFSTHLCEIDYLSVKATVTGEAIVSWNDYGETCLLRYRPEGGAWTTVTGITGSEYTITGLSIGNYEVGVAMDCDPTNFNTATFTIMEVFSTANWYGYVDYSVDGEAWAYDFISFSMQNPSTVTAATSTTVIPTFASAYANGYVWSIDVYNGDLTRAVLNNTDKTISAFETIVSGFEPNAAYSLAYNPTDGRMYYTNDLMELRSFDPAAPVSTLVGTLDDYYIPLAINRFGEAYAFKFYTDEIYQVNLSDATTTLVGATGRYVEHILAMAFDMQTDELFFAHYDSDSDVGLYKVDPITAATCSLGQIGGGGGALLTTLFMGGDATPSCPAPTNLTVSNITLTSALLDWDQSGGGYEWVVKYSTDPDFSSYNIEWVISSSYPMLDLAPGTTYYVRVQSICPMSILGEWSSTLTFTTEECPAPIDVTVSNITSTSAEVSWTSVGADYEWDIEYSTDPSFSTYEIEWAISNIWTIDNLTPGTTYYVRVESACYPSIQGGTSSVVSFTTTGSTPCQAPTDLAVETTAPGAAIFSWTSGNDYNLRLREVGGEWMYFDEVSSPYPIITLGANTDYEAQAQLNCGSNGLSAWGNLVSFTTLPCPAPTNLTVSNVTLTTAELSWSQSGGGYEWNVEYSTSPDFSSSTTEWVISSSYPMLGLAPGTTYYVRVQSICPINLPGEWSSTISFTTEECPAPTNVTVSNITATTAKVSWTSVGADYEWDIEYSIDPSFSTYEIEWAISNIWTIDNLTPGTTYYVRVQSACYPSIPGGTSSVVSFTTEIGCPAPENLTVLSTTSNTVTLEWISEVPTDLYIYDGIGGMLPLASNQTSPYIVTGLQPSTQYYFKAINHCGDEGTSWWSNTISATTDEVYCTAPMNLTVSNVTKNSATVDWTETGIAENWFIVLNNNETDAIQVIGHPYTLTGLTPETTYTVSVYSGCDFGIFSPWSSPVTFTTDVACPAPNDLAVSSVGAVSAVLTWTSGDIYNLRYRASSGGSWVEILGDTLTSPAAITGLQSSTAYEVQAQRVCGTDGYSSWGNIVSFTTESCAIPTDLEIVSVTATSITVTWASGLLYNVSYRRSGQLWSIAYNVIPPFTLTNLTPGTEYRIRVQDICSTGTNNYSTVQVINTAACTTPDNLAIASITDNSATVSWTTGDTYNLRYRETGGEWTDVAGVTSPYTITGLHANGSYEVMAQHDCGSDGVSDWSATVPFTSAPCDPIAVPYAYDFETEDPFYCWRPVAGEVERNHITVASYNHTAGGEYALTFFENASDLVALPQFAQETSGLQVMFWLRPQNNVFSGNGTFEVGYLTDVADASTFTAVSSYSYEDWVSNAYVRKIVAFPGAPAGATIAFRHNSPTANGVWYVDDILVSAVCPMPGNIVVTNVTNNSATVTWTDNGADSWDVSLVDLDAYAYNTATNQYTLTGLNAGATYNIKVRSNCGGGSVSDWSEKVYFTTSTNVVPAYATITGESSVCQSHVTLLTANTDVEATYYWSTGETTRQINAGPGTYTVIVTSTTGDQLASAPFTVAVKPNYAVTESRSVCPDEIPYTWNGFTFYSTGMQPVTLTASNGCDSIVTMILSVNPTYNTPVSAEICQGSSYNFFGEALTTGGTYTHTLQSQAGCDSVITLTLTVNPTYAVSATKTICAGELPYTWNGVTFTEAGTQTATLQTALGCDSVVTMTLHVNPEYTTPVSAAICQGESYNFFGEALTTGGTYSHTLQTVKGCDSVVVLTLTVNPTYAVPATKTICAGELPYTWNGVTFTEAGTQTVTLQTVNHCDSVVTMTLHVNPAYTVPMEASICNGEAYTFFGQMLTASGEYTHLLQTVDGCDSLIVLTLTVNPTYSITEERTVCSVALPYTWNGVVFTGPATKFATLQTVNGLCDSVVTMVLSVSDAFEVTENRSVCVSDLPYVWNGKTFNAAGTQTVTLTASNSCDSIVTMVLTVNSPVHQAYIVEECGSYTWTDGDGETYTVSSDHIYSHPDAHGCTQVDTLHLTINNPVHTAITIEACGSYTWTDGNSQTYYASGDYLFNHTDVHGCTQVDTLHLTVYTPENSVVTAQVCGSFNWNGQDYTTSGTYTYGHSDVHGCTQVDTLKLTIYNPVHQSYTVEECGSYTWTEGDGVTYTTSGDRIYSHEDAHGCEQVDTLHLTIYNPVNQVYEVEACESYTWTEGDGQTYTAPGTYMYEHQDAHGCLQIDTLILDLHQPVHQSYHVQSCESYTWTFGDGQTYTTSGVHTYTHIGMNGCTQVDTLYLTIKEVENTSTTVEACHHYTWTDGTHDTYYVSGDYIYHHVGPNGCGQDDTLHLTIYNPVHQAYTVEACESYTWEDGDGQTYTTSGLRTYAHEDDHGCTQVDTLHLTILHGTSSVVANTICADELPYVWNGVTFTEAGMQTATLEASNGCDSVVTMVLMVNTPVHHAYTAEACASYTWLTGTGETYYVSGDYLYSHTDINGCTQVDTLHLTVFPTTNSALTVTACGLYTWTEGDGQTYATSGVHTYSHLNEYGCFQVDTLYLTIHNPVHQSYTVSECGSYTWTEGNGLTYTTSGDYTYSHLDANGCTQVDTLHLTILQSSSAVLANTVCAGDLPYVWNGVTFTAAGMQTATIQAANGCDSVVTMVLMVNSPVHHAYTAEACGSYTWVTGDGQTYTASGDYTYSHLDVNGCTQVDTLHLTILAPAASSVETTVCSSALPYTWNGVTFTAAGTQSVTLTAANGCDSVVTMTLTVNNAYTATDAATVCPSALPYTWNGVTFTAAGTQTVTLTAANGCDSVVTMTLTVNNAYTATDAMTVCPSALPYTWNGVTFTAAGTQTVTLTAANGCDSVVTMTLTVNEIPVTDLYESSCGSYFWNNSNYTETGNYTVTFTAASGCDSVVTLHLTINQSVQTELYVTECDSYTWADGNTYTQSDDYSMTLTAANGCDSIVILHLTIHNSTSSEFTIETADSCYTWNGQTYCASGDYVQTLQTANGCDSVVTLHLTTSVGVELFDVTALYLAPNPAKSVCRIVGLETDPVSVGLYDMRGKLLRRIDRTEFDVSTLPTGMYMVRVNTGERVVNLKLIRQ